MKVIEASGTFRQVGESVGEATREEIDFLYNQTVPALLESVFHGDELTLRRAAHEYFRLTKQYFFEATDYLRGLADGSGFPLGKLLPIVFCEEIASAVANVNQTDKCSTLVTRASDGWVLGHQEDYWPDFYGKLPIYDLKFKGFPRLVCLNYPGNLPGVAGALNEAGVAITNNSLWPPSAPGIPKQVKHFRATLGRGHLEALHWLWMGPHVLTDHFTVIYGEDGLAASLEVTSNPAAPKEVEFREIIFDDRPEDEVLIKEPFWHTNNVRWLEPWVSGKVADPAHPGSAMRARKLRKIALDPPRSPEAMLKLLRLKDGILNRDQEINLTEQPNSVTLATTVIRPETREAWFVGYGDGDEEPRYFQL